MMNSAEILIKLSEIAEGKFDPENSQTIFEADPQAFNDTLLEFFREDQNLPALKWLANLFPQSLSLIFFDCIYHEWKEGIEAILAFSPNVALEIEDEHTCLFQLAKSKEFCEANQALMNQIINLATFDQLVYENHRMRSALYMAHAEENDAFIEASRIKAIENNRVDDFDEYNNFALKISEFENLQEYPNLFAQTQKIRQYLIKKDFEPKKYGDLAQPSVPSMLAALIGKKLSRVNKGGGRQPPADPYHVKLFNHTNLALYLKNMLDKKQEFIVNTIVIKLDVHFYSLLCMSDFTADGGGVIKAISLEPLCGEHKELIEACAAQNIRLDLVSLGTRIQNGETGCRFMAMYFSEKLSRISTHVQAIQLHRSLISSDKKFSLEKFPIEYGLMTVCQSLSTIHGAVSKLGEADLARPVNHLGEIYQTRLNRGILYLKDSQGNQKAQNRCLDQKIPHHLERALSVIGLDQNYLSDALQDILGIKEIYPGQSRQILQSWMKKVDCSLNDAFSSFDFEFEKNLIDLSQASDPNQRAIHSNNLLGFFSKWKKRDYLESKISFLFILLESCDQKALENLIHSFLLKDSKILYFLDSEKNIQLVFLYNRMNDNLQIKVVEKFAAHVVNKMSSGWISSDLIPGLCPQAKEILNNHLEQIKQPQENRYLSYFESLSRKNRLILGSQENEMESPEAENPVKKMKIGKS